MGNEELGIRSGMPFVETPSKEEEEKNRQAIVAYLQNHPDGNYPYLVRGFKCKPEIVGNRWEMAHGDTKIVRNGGAFAEADAVPAVTMGSFLVCRHGGLIEPVTSGRENRETARRFTQVKTES